MSRLPKGRLEQLLAALVITLVLVGAAILLPTFDPIWENRMRG